MKRKLVTITALMSGLIATTQVLAAPVMLNCKVSAQTSYGETIIRDWNFWDIQIDAEKRIALVDDLFGRDFGDPAAKRDPKNPIRFEPARYDLLLANEKTNTSRSYVMRNFEEYKVLGNTLKSERLLFLNFPTPTTGHVNQRVFPVLITGVRVTQVEDASKKGRPEQLQWMTMGECRTIQN